MKTKDNVIVKIPFRVFPCLLHVKLHKFGHPIYIHTKSVQIYSAIKKILIFSVNYSVSPDY